jgi:hypothetical protein
LRIPDPFRGPHRFNPADRVEDDGGGIDPAGLPFVFDRFYRADKARGADAGKMGLGLAICKAPATAQGGTIAAESAGKGRGTAVNFIPSRSRAISTISVSGDLSVPSSSPFQEYFQSQQEISKCHSPRSFTMRRDCFR